MSPNNWKFVPSHDEMRGHDEIAVPECWVHEETGEIVWQEPSKTPRFDAAYKECLDDTGAITRLEPLYNLCKQLETQINDMTIALTPEEELGQLKEAMGVDNDPSANTHHAPKVEHCFRVWATEGPLGPEIRNSSRVVDTEERARELVEQRNPADQSVVWGYAPITIESIHEATKATMKSNNWEYPFALGYVSGLEDAQRGRKAEHNGAELDDYAKGYCKGYSSHGELIRLKAEREELQGKLDRVARIYHVPPAML